MAEETEAASVKVTLKNRARAARGITLDNGTVTSIAPGEEKEVEVPEYMVERLQKSSESGGDLEVTSGGQARAKMKTR